VNPLTHGDEITAQLQLATFLVLNVYVCNGHAPMRHGSSVMGHVGHGSTV